MLLDTLNTVIEPQLKKVQVEGHTYFIEILAHVLVRISSPKTLAIQERLSYNVLEDHVTPNVCPPNLPDLNP